MRSLGGLAGSVAGALGSFVLASTVVACSEEGEGGLACGSGTVKVGKECVPMAPEDGGAGGTSSGGASSGAGAGGSPVQSGGGAASDAGTGGAAAGGAGGTGAGGAASDAGTGGVAAGGADGAAPGDGGHAGAGGSGPSLTTSRWLAFEVGDSSFVYDTATFPERTAIPMGTGFPAGVTRTTAWSPDGRWLLHFDTDGLYVRDMTGGDAPGAAVFLGSFQPSLTDRWEWSADSASLLYQRNGDLFTLDPTEAAPVLHPVTTGATRATWAPAGNHLLYGDAGGFHVVAVAAGVPGTAKQILGDPARPIVSWLSGAPQVLTLVPWNNVLIDPRPEQPTSLTLPSSPTASFQNLAGVGYPNSTGDLVAWAQSGQILYATIGASGVGPTQEGTPPSGSTITTHSWWGTRLLYTVGGQYSWFDLGSGTPSPARSIPLPQVTGGPRRSPNGHVALTISGAAPTKIESFDLASVETEARHLQDEPLEVTSATFSSDGQRLAYLTGGVLKVVSVSAGPATPILTSGSSVGGDTAVVSTLGWSRNDGFIAFTQTLNGVRDVVGLVRLNGSAASAPVFVSDETQESLSFVFQP